MSNEYVLFGGGAFAIEVASYLSDVNSYRLLSEAPDILRVTDVVSSEPARVDDIGNIIGRQAAFHSDISFVKNIDSKAVVICIGDSFVRHRIYQELVVRGVKFGRVVHPSAYVAATARLGDGCIVCPFVFVGPYATVENNVALNVGAIVGHDVIINDSAVLSPGSCMNGHSKCGTAAFLGAGGTLLPEAVLGDFSKLSAGSVLNKTVGAGVA